MDFQGGESNFSRRAGSQGNFSRRVKGFFLRECSTMLNWAELKSFIYKGVGNN